MLAHTRLSRATYDAIESAAESEDSLAVAAKQWIDSLMDSAFAEARSLPLPDGMLKLNGSDPAERVAEALAIWLCESDPERFADILTGYECRSALPLHLRLYVEQLERKARQSESV